MKAERVLVIFRSRMRAGADVEGYSALSRTMHELVQAHPGFISIESVFTTDDEEISFELFESAESVAAWRANPDHRDAQARGINEFFSEYSVTVCAIEREYQRELDAPR